jgi:hypothetical protein
MEKEYKEFDGLFFDINTDGKVIKELCQAYRGKYRIRLWYGDELKSWNEEHDTIGTIGRSTGKIKIPLLIKSSRSYGGGAILDNCIVRIDVNYGGCKKTRYIKEGVYFPLFYTLYDGDVLKVYYDDINGKRTEYGHNKTEKGTINLCNFMNGFSWKK